MRIAINTLAMGHKLYGVGNYIKHLVASLSKIDAHNEYLLFASRENEHHLQDLGGNFRIQYAPGNRSIRLPWEQTILPFRLKQERIDLYHGPTFVTPLIKTSRQVVSILDMTFYLTPERHSLHKRIYFRTMIPKAIRRSDGVIAISDSTKRDLLRLLEIEEGNKISLVPLGVDSRFYPRTDEAELAGVRTKYGLPPNFILSVGLIEPRKNLRTLVEAYESAGLADDFELVVAGSLGWGYEALLRQIADSPVGHRIRMPGYVADADLPALYSLATVFVYPSLYEGFGLPVLEAMACGVPVITSDTSSLPEVAADAGVLFDPSSSPALASALQKVLGSGQLRQLLSQRGRERAGLFTWELTARKTLAAYEGAAVH